tara:strand:+ start:326 stop:967 length:642 start_codon:yes stop_codon:yes gene_type:complete
MIVGDVAAWAESFKRYDERLLERICEILPKCIAALGGDPIEDQITINLVDRFHLDETIRKMFHHWEYQFEPFGHDENGAAFSKGKIDFVVCWDTERERYLAYEAKRLNVPNAKGGVSSLATIYVTEGLVRFVKEQYSEGLPIGCMLGYVLDGNVTTVQSKVQTAISKNSTLVGLAEGPSPIASIGTASRFSSVHVRDGSGTSIDIRHALVPCN